jgi:hypothetical protein
MHGGFSNTKASLMKLDTGWRGKFHGLNSYRVPTSARKSAGTAA